MTTGTTELPEALKPWHPWLTWFAPELAAELGALVQRMQPLLGRFKGQVGGGAPEPDGLDDLRRRGPYERLLATEWLLADELPDEFLRRAAASEHLFLAPRPRAREAEKSIVAIFDAGPLQFGAPRLGQIALWILLARRAAQVGGVFQWGVLQAPGALHDVGDATQLRALLHARAFTVGDDTHASAWQAALAALQRAPGESWLIGCAPADPPRAQRWTSHRVSLQRAVLGDVLEVSLSEPQGLRRAQLPLPSAKAAVPLLKGWFTPQASANLHRRHRGRISLQRPPVISPRGGHVAVQLLDEPGAVIFPVTDPHQRKAANPRYPRWGDRLEPLALMFSGKQLGALLSDTKGMQFWQVAGLGRLDAPPVDVFQAPPGRAAWLASAWLRQGMTQRLCMLDMAGSLVMWNTFAITSQSLPVSAPTQVEARVLGMAQWSEEGLVYVAVRSGQLALCRLGVEGGPSTLLPVGPAPDNATVLLAGGNPWRNGVGACAVRLSLAADGHETWRIHEPDPASAPTIAFGQPKGLQGPQKWTAFEAGLHRGLALVHDTTLGGHAVLALSGARDALVLHSRQGSQIIYTAPERIEQIAVCPNTGLAVLLTEHRQVIFYDVPQRLMRAVRHGEDAPDVDPDAAPDAAPDADH